MHYASAAAIVAGRSVNGNVNAMVVPGSGLVKLQAEEEAWVEHGPLDGAPFEPWAHQPAGAGAP